MSSIAVVIPLFNHASYIQSTLDSVYAQKIPPDRVIVIDDGSQDDSFAVVKKHARSNTEVILQKNIGAHHTLNRGIEMAADCEWIAVLNSDDIWHPDRFSRCLEFAQKNPDRSVICTGLHLIDRLGIQVPDDSPKMRRNLKIWDGVKRKNDPLLSLAISNFAKTTSNVFARRDFLLAHLFGNYRYVHDYHFLLHAAFANALAIIPEDLLGYRVHDTNTIKADGRRAVVSETILMIRDLFGELSASLQNSASMRKRARLFFQGLLGNHTDFRGEIFITLLADVIARNPGQFDPHLLGELEEFDNKSEPLPQ